MDNAVRSFAARDVQKGPTVSPRHSCADERDEILSHELEPLRQFGKSQGLLGILGKLR